MDLTKPAAPRSDQLNADDLISGPQTLTIDRVVEGSDEQPVAIHLAETPGRPWKPSKGMLRVLIAAWGADTDTWTGTRRVTLFRNPEVRFGGSEVGGIQISAMSHIDKPIHLALTVKRGVKKPYKVEPLREVAKPADPTPAEIAALSDVGALRELWSQVSDEQIKALIVARVNELRADPATGEIGGEG